MTAFKLLRNIKEKTHKFMVITKRNRLSKNLAGGYQKPDGVEDWLSKK